MHIGIPVYEKVDLLDVAGPHEIFGWLPHFDMPCTIDLVAQECGDVTTRDGVTFKISKNFNDIDQFDVLWVPGGDPAALTLLISGPDRGYLDFLIAQAAHARYVCSVCEGAMLLGAAGLLANHTATTHWAFIPCLEKFEDVSAAPGFPRFWLHGNRLTGGGISSGLDEAFKLIELLYGDELAQKIQRQTQYYPEPPVVSQLHPATECPLTILNG